MISLIIVDDEQLEVEGIMNTVDFSRLGIGVIRQAFNVVQAKEVFARQPVDILLCDIEMPAGTGLDLLEWVREYHPKTECIFLTCHADFRYARRAMQLGSLDYLLKPAKPGELEKILTQAIAKIQTEIRATEHSQFSKLWLKYQPVLVERFWLDVISQKISSTPEALQEAAESINFPGIERVKILPALINVQCWHENMTLRDEKIMEFALKNIASEMLFRQEEDGIIIEISRGRLLIIFYLDPGAEPDAARMNDDFNGYLAACNRYLACDLSCYIGEMTDAHRLVDMLSGLNALEKNRSAFTNRVVFLKQLTSFKNSLVIEKARAYIEQNLNAHLTREDVANHVYMNPDYLNRIFKKETGMLISDYILQERIKMAKELLTSSNLTITEIAMRVGFANFPYFSTMFKKYTKMNPVDYRKNELNIRS